MKIRQQTSTLLILHHQPTGLRLLYFFLTVMWSGQLWYNLHRPVTASLTCTRIQSDQTVCQLSTFNLLEGSHTLPIKDLQKATVQEERLSTRSKSMYKTILQASNGEFFMISKWDGEGSQTAASRINDFVAHKEQRTLKVVESAVIEVLVYLLFVPLLGWSIWTGVLAPVEICLFDKSANKFVFIRKRLFLENKIEYPIDAILSVRIEEAKSRFMPKKIALWLATEKHRFLHRGVSQGKSIFLNTGLSNEKKLDKIIDAIEEFIKS